MLKKLLCVLAALALIFCASAEEYTMNDIEPLHELAAQHGFKMGAALSFYQMNDRAYLEVVARHFNSITATNEMKAYSLLDQYASKKSEDGMPRMNYSQADRMVAWAQANGIGVRGHVLVWDAYMTEWFFHEDYDVKKPIVSREVMRDRLKSYIDQVIAHFEEKYPGVVYCWDVVNEAVGDNLADYDPTDARHIRVKRSGAPNPFYEYVGRDYVEYSFLCARETVDRLGCSTRLFYNDYNTFYAEKRLAITALIESINSYAVNEDGTPRKLADGIGMQGYIGGYGTQNGCMNRSDLNSIKTSVMAYSALGLEVQLTEMAVRNYDVSQADKHAEFYASLFKLFVSLNEDEPRLTGVSIWGLTDNPSVPKSNYNYSMNSTYGGLITEKYLPKRATELVVEALKGN